MWYISHTQLENDSPVKLVQMHIELVQILAQILALTRFAIPGYCLSKSNKSSETKLMVRLKDPIFASPVREIHFEIQIYELLEQGTEKLQILEN